MASEGDQWFARNRQALEQFDPDADFPLRLMELYDLRPTSVLEIGAANGVRLAAIAAHYGARVVAVEPSSEATRCGRARFSQVTFVQGTACALPLSESFELIIVNFVFHWIDRANLLRSIAEIDRLLVDGGFLIIGDFYPSNMVKLQYHHLAEQEMFTFKQNYAATFIGSGLYHPVCLITGDHASHSLAGAVDEDERIGVWLLQKKLREHYAEGTFRPGGE